MEASDTLTVIPCLLQDLYIVLTGQGRSAQVTRLSGECHQWSMPQIAPMQRMFCCANKAIRCHLLILKPEVSGRGTIRLNAGNTFSGQQCLPFSSVSCSEYFRQPISSGMFIRWPEEVISRDIDIQLFQHRNEGVDLPGRH